MSARKGKKVAKAVPYAETEVAKKYASEFSALTKDMEAKALKLIHEAMPKKVVDLNAKWAALPLFQELSPAAIAALDSGVGLEVKSASTDTEMAAADSKSASSSSAQPSKKRKAAEALSSGAKPLPSQDELAAKNEEISTLYTAVKKEVLELIDTLGAVKIYIQLNIPKIEDGNNFGVGVQEDTLGEIGRAEDASFMLLEGMTKYFITRAKLVSKCLKYPMIDDYKQSVMELDEKQYIQLQLACLDIRNNYAVLHDMIVKNLEKIIAPRGANHHSTMV